jgi:MoaA/NifB/PqqE/SkfB family radical SAM enzyme
MDKTKSIKTSMGTNGHLDLYLGGTSIDQKIYRSMIRSLLYLCASRPNIMLSVYMCARFQTAPKDYHLRVVKRIMSYLVLIPNLGIWYPLDGLDCPGVTKVVVDPRKFVLPSPLWRFDSGNRTRSW